MHDLWIEQVKHFFVVDLQEAHEDRVVPRRVRGLHLFDAPEKLVDAPLRDAEVFVLVARRARLALPHVTPLHRVSLARAGLTVSENCSVVALRHKDSPG